MIADESTLWRYWADELGWGRGRHSRVVFRFLIRAAEAAAGGVVLDAGAGTRRYEPFFGRSLYLAQEHQAGVDAKRLTDYHILADLKTIPLADASVDLVLSTVSVEHLRDPSAFFQEAWRVLTPGGSLWVQVPFVYYEHEAPYDFQRPTRYGLLRWFEDAGFERADVQPASSSIAAVAAFIPYALEEDVGRRRRVVRLAARPLVRASRGLSRLLVALFDRGPCPETTMPVGWVSTGWKPGRRATDDSVRESSASTFLAARRLEDPRAVLRGGVLTWTGD